MADLDKKNVDERDKIIFGEKYKQNKYLGGCRSFSDLDVDALKQLIDMNFIDLEECQNFSPSVEEFYEFMKSHPCITCHGYAVSPERSDYRVTIEGLEYIGIVTMEMLVDFVDMFREADEFSVSTNGLYCWYD